MRIGINILYLLPGVVGGTETYALSLLRAIAAVDSENEYFVFGNRECEHLDLTPGPNFTRIDTGLRATSRSKRYLWEQCLFPIYLRRFGLDLLHSLGYVGPFRPPCPHVVTVHDVNYRGQGNAMSLAKRVLLRFFIERSATGAAQVVTISHYSRGQIMQHMGISGEKITVIHLGPRTYGEVPSETVDKVLKKYLLPPRYLLAFSSTSKHKNIPRLLRAYATLCNSIPHALVLLGHFPVGNVISREIQKLGLEGRVYRTGFVRDEEVMPILGRAELLIFPSLYEGFGLPVLDAQQLGTPVACSNSGSLPEVAGLGAAFFDPTAEREMAATISATIASEKRLNALRDSGRDNIRRFSWENTAAETLKVYEIVAKGATRYLQNHHLTD